MREIKKLDGILKKELTKKRNLGVIIITHDMGVIAETTNKVIVMRHGVIVEQGNTKDLLTNPKSTEARSLVISVPPTNKKIDRFKLISPEGKEITSSSANLTKNIIKTWGPIKIKTAIKILTATDLQLRSSNQQVPQIALVERLFIRIAMLLKS